MASARESIHNSENKVTDLTLDKKAVQIKNTSLISKKDKFQTPNRLGIPEKYVEYSHLDLHHSTDTLNIHIHVIFPH